MGSSMRSTRIPVSIRRRAKCSRSSSSRTSTRSCRPQPRKSFNCAKVRRLRSRQQAARARTPARSRRPRPIAAGVDQLHGESARPQPRRTPAGGHAGHGRRRSSAGERYRDSGHGLHRRYAYERLRGRRGVAKTTPVHDVSDDGAEAIVTGLAAGSVLVKDVEAATSATAIAFRRARRPSKCG